MGIDVRPDDYILMNPAKNRQAYTRQNLYTRLQRVLKHSGLEQDLLQEGKKLYYILVDTSYYDAIALWKGAFVSTVEGGWN